MLSHGAGLIGLGVCSACMHNNLIAVLKPKSNDNANATEPGGENAFNAEELVDFTPSTKDPKSVNDPKILDQTDLDILDSESSRSLRQTPYTKKLSAFEQYKILHFDEELPEDIFLEKEKHELLKSARRKIDAVQRYTGHGHFNLVGLDELFHLSHKCAGDNAFTAKEKLFFEEFFHAEANKYGFFGKKVITKITDNVSKKDVVKVPYSGHYLYKDVSLPIFNRLKKDVGQDIILTSGVRGIAKQIHLFLAKIEKVNFNISQASRSLAPPGYSYHAIGDFDIGQKGLGELNFTKTFSGTHVYKRLKELGYIEIRYSTDNPFGVRFEPWHIEGGKRRV